MFKKIMISLLLVVPARNVVASEVGLGSGLADAVNETIIDPKSQELFAGIIDLFLDNISYSQEQWQKMDEFLKEGLELLRLRTSESFIALQKEYDREHQELFEAIFDQDGNVDIAGAQEFLKEALEELQKDARFELIHVYQKLENVFKQKVATALLADLSIANKSENKTVDTAAQLAQIESLVSHVISRVEAKIAQ